MPENTEQPTEKPSRPFWQDPLSLSVAGAFIGFGYPDVGLLMTMAALAWVCIIKLLVIAFHRDG